MQYLVIPDSTNPYLLARVRWPDVAQAITAGCPDWLEDPGLFDLPIDPSSVAVTFERAAAIAASWGVNLDSEETFHSSGPSLIRRMPADWSNLVPAEIHAWSLDFVDTGRRVESRPETSRARGRHAPSHSRMHPGRWLLGALSRPRRRPALEMRIANSAGPSAIEPARAQTRAVGPSSIPTIAIPETFSSLAAENGHFPTIVMRTEEPVSERPSIGDPGAPSSPKLNGDHSDHTAPSPRGRRGSPGTTKNMNGRQPSGSNGSNGSSGPS